MTVITDQTEYNFNVNAFVAEMLHSEYNPDHIFRNIDQTFILNRVITRQ